MPLPPPLGGSLPLGYPAILAGLALVLPPPTAALLVACFAGYLVLGRTVVGLDDGFGGGWEEQEQEEEEEEEDAGGAADLLALAGAVATAGLLSPAGLSASAPAGAAAALVALGGAVLIASAAGQAREQARGEEEEDPGRRMMDRWDERFERSRRNGGDGDDDR